MNRWIAPLAAMVTLSCQEDDLAKPATTRSEVVETAAAIQESEIYEAPHMLQLAREVPEFAGFYYDDDGRIVVAVTDPARFNNARDGIRELFAEDHSSTGSETFIQKTVEYSFLELARYRTALGGYVFGIEGVISIGVDEENNRVKIGVSEPGVRVAVGQIISKLEIPAETVVFWDAPVPVETSHTLNSSIPGGKLLGGYRIETDSTYCTLGFPALRRSNMDEVIITNSHCTNIRASLDNGYFGQPSKTPYVAQEILDPGTHTCTWLLIFTKPCRHSDSAMLETSADIDLGKIARTTASSGCESCSQPLTIDHNNPTISITGRRNWNAGNETLQKIGRTTGWTYGGVEDTCEDYLVDGIVWRCSDRVDFSVSGGDSGSPVFKLVSGFAHLRGIVFGYFGIPFYDALISNLGQVETDLGELVVYDPGPPVVTIEGPTSVKTGLLCTWTAEISAGITPFTYSWSGLFSGSTDSIARVTVSSGWLNISVTDWKSRTSSTSVYITVDANGPIPAGCIE